MPPRRSKARAAPAPAEAWRGGPPAIAPDYSRVSQMMDLPPPAPNQTDRVLPINLPTALCLSQARPLVIAFAQNSVEKVGRSASRRQGRCGCRTSISASGYSHHDGAIQGTFGEVAPRRFRLLFRSARARR